MKLTLVTKAESYDPDERPLATVSGLQNHRQRHQLSGQGVIP